MNKVSHYFRDSYKELMETIIEIVDNPKNEHKGMSIGYKLNETQFVELERELFYMDPNNTGRPFKSNHLVEILMDGITVTITKKK